jgi:hypothetical protein
MEAGRAMTQRITDAAATTQCATCEGAKVVASGFGINDKGVPGIVPCPDCSGAVAMSSETKTPSADQCADCKSPAACASVGHCRRGFNATDDDAMLAALKRRYAIEGFDIGHGATVRDCIAFRAGVDYARHPSPDIRDAERLRDRFEAWISAPPFERDVERWHRPDSQWPGQYRDYPVQVAWEAWQAGSKDAD